MLGTLVFVPYSERSFVGISGDVLLHRPDAEIVAMVMEGETPPEGVRSLSVARTGHFDLFVAERGRPTAVVANGGPTPLGVAAVLLSQRLRAYLWNVQRDGITAMNNEPEY